MSTPTSLTPGLLHSFPPHLWPLWTCEFLIFGPVTSKPFPVTGPLLDSWGTQKNLLKIVSFNDCIKVGVNAGVSHIVLV